MSPRRFIITFCIPALTLVGMALPASAQENPYFITYTHHMEEPGSLEVAINPVFGVPQGGARQFVASSIELEYGVNGWWTSELYLDSQKTSRESTLFTGYRFENLFRLLMKEHAVNPRWPFGSRYVTIPFPPRPAFMPSLVKFPGSV